jgi:hypothetical protein
LGEALAKMNLTTGELAPADMQTVMQRDPDLGVKILENAMTLRQQAGKQEHWEPIPTPQGETGQWFRNSVTGEPKKVGGSAADAAAGAKLSDIGSLRDDYTKAATTYDASAPSWQSMKEAAATSLSKDAGEEGKGAADYNMIVGYAKLLDPNSVVREGEVQSATNLGGMKDTVQGWLNTWLSQGKLSDPVRRAIMKEGFSRIKAYSDQVKTKRDWLSGVAERHGIKAEDVVAPFTEATPFEEPTAGQGGGGTTVVKTEKHADGTSTATTKDGTKINTSADGKTRTVTTKDGHTYTLEGTE